jgi:hypothetical protein
MLGEICHQSLAQRDDETASGLFFGQSCRDSPLNRTCSAKMNSRGSREVQSSLPGLLTDTIEGVVVDLVGYGTLGAF